MTKKNRKMADWLKIDFLKYSDDIIRDKGKKGINLVKEIDVSEDYSDGFLDIFGVVKSKEWLTDSQETHINIDLRSNEINEFECDCYHHYQSTMDGEKLACEHIAATYYKYINMLECNKIDYPNLEVLAEQEKYNKGLELLERLGSSIVSNRELVNIEISLIEKDYNSYQASFKVGNKKLYVVKNIFEFIKAMDNKSQLGFGKGFVYDGSIHKFSKEDMKIIDFIREYANISEALNEGSNQGYGFGYYGYNRGNSARLIKNKVMILVGPALKRFLELASDKTINMEATYFKGKTNIIMDNIPLSLSLKEENDNIILEKNGEFPRELIRNSGVFLYDEKIYIPTDDQKEQLLPFVNIFSRDDSAIFKKAQAEKVFTTLVPAIKAIANELVVNEAIEEKVTSEELELEFYFDRDRTSSWCMVKCKYGNEVFDMLQGYKGEKYLIRDLKKENDVINSLSNFKFYIDKDKFKFTGDDEELYNFLFKGIESLSSIGEVYYSDRFKEQKVYKSGAISAAVGEKGGFLEFSFDIDQVDPNEFNNILKAFRSNRKFYKLKNDSFISLEEKETQGFLELLDNILGDKKLKGNKFEISKNKAIYLSDTIRDKNLNFINGNEVVDNIKESFATLDKVDYKLPEELKATLREYQITGFNWFKTVNHYGFGGILADEMGLGKTVQTIAFLLSEKGKKSLIVTPTSLIYNWKNEFEKFAPTMKVCTLHGTKEERTELFEKVEEYDVILTTYGTLRNDFERYEELAFDYCIIDEGQNIKNPLAQSSEAVKEVKAKVKFALTGTPIENNLMELWSIFDFVMPGYLYNKSRFQEKFIGAKDDRAIAELKKLIRPFVLRRLKINVMKELPDKIEKKFFVEMTEEQKKVYSTFVKDIQEKMENQDFSKDKITVFSYLTKLRQLCLDPSIIVDGYIGGSAKIDVALDIIKENIESNNKILLFSQFTSVLANIKEVLDHNNIGYYYLDGQTKASNRVNMVNSFNSDKEKKVFLISLKAGGTGLNLTSANIVVHFDPWWNPAIEDQATDRAHRIGQKNIVEVIKLISQGTVEEKIITMQESKKELINQVMEGDFKEGSFLKNLKDNEIVELFKF